MSEKKYIFSFFLYLGVLLLLVAAFDRVVDPFWYYRDISIHGFNEIKPKFRRYERHVKPAILEREQPGAVIFGSSYSEIGFDPSRLADLTGDKAYNFALAGAGWDMVYCDVQYALKYDHHLRWIVLGIHPQSMPVQDCNLPEMHHPDLVSFLLSTDALKASLETVLEQAKSKPSHTAQGLYFYTRGLSGTEARFREYLPAHAPCSLNHPAENPDRNPDLTGLRNILREAARRKIGVKLVVYPRHAIPVELEYLCKARQARWEVLSVVASLVEAESGKNDRIQLWDFEGFHPISLEKISNAPAVYWQDPAHFNFEYGNLMLDEMFGKSAPEYGYRLTTEDIPVREQAERIAREQYLKLHPEFDKKVESLSRTNP
ncbi:MAG: hypothetical protein HKL98_07365 [Burkholderiales bacterium]|nr:hypothetical protein [Burkholderiales bacterium]